jgi:hypothetical protein
LTVFVALTALLLLPVLYILSIGPAAWLMQNGYLSLSAFDTCYTPAAIAADIFDLRTWLGWYASLWID